MPEAFPYLIAELFTMGSFEVNTFVGGLHDFGRGALQLQRASGPLATCRHPRPGASWMERRQLSWGQWQEGEGDTLFPEL